MPVLLAAAIHKQRWLSRWEVAALGLALLGLASTRFAAASGQITFLVLDLMLVTLVLSERKPWLAGACLGMALSKYSLAIGIFLVFLLFDPNPRLLLGAALVQLAGVIGLMFLSGSGFLEIVNEYLRMALWHAGREGIHLAAAFRAQEYLLWIALGLTLLVAIPLAVWSLRNAIWRRDRSISTLNRFQLATILLMWSLLIGYHRAYDALSAIVFFNLVFCLEKKPEFWVLQTRTREILSFFAGFALLLLMVPSGNIVRGLLPDSWDSIWGLVENFSVTILILLFLTASIALLLKTKINDEDLLTFNHH
jgi:hypothetical protein